MESFGSFFGEFWIRHGVVRGVAIPSQERASDSTEAPLKVGIKLRRGLGEFILIAA